MASLKVIDIKHQACGAGSILSATVLFPDSSAKEIWIQGIEFPLVENLVDPLLLAVLMPAMSLGCDIYIEGKVSEYLLSSLAEWQSAWNTWFPKQYRTALIEAADVEKGVRRMRTTMIALSGGLDSTYSLLKDRFDQPYRRYEPAQVGMFIHGQDIPLSHQNEFNFAKARVAKLADEFGVILLSTATNIRDFLPSIEDGHALLIGAAMTSASHYAGTAILAASTSLKHLVVEYGSNPITDTWLSSSRMEFIHDGIQLTRLEKMEYLAENRPDLLGSLIVCPHLTPAGKNCGRCEKCLRTWLAMQVIGIDSSSNYEEQPHLYGYDLSSPMKRPFWETIEQEAKARGRQDIAELVRSQLDASPLAR